MNHYTNLIDAIKGLRNEGYTEDFNIKFNVLECGDYCLRCDEFEIDKSYRFDNDTDPADQSVIYAISSSDNKIKGILINSYGLYSEDITDEMIEKLKG